MGTATKPAGRIAGRIDAPPLESSIMRAIGKRLTTMGAWYRKNSPSAFGYKVGTLDFTIIYRGRGIALEVKRPAKKHKFESDTLCPHCWKRLTKLQRREILAVRAAGGFAHVVCSADEAESALRRAVK